MINDWLADYCRHAPTRLFGMGVLPQTSAALALAEAKRCLEELDFRGVWRRPERIAGTPALHDPDYEPLWSYLEEADRPLALHPGLNGLVPCAELRHRLDDDYSAMHAVHFPMEQMLGLTELVTFGILDRHPRLRVAFLETGAVWALAHLHRLDEHLELFGFPKRPKEKPSDQFRRQGFVSVEEVEPGLAVMLDAYPESVVFASDYPHGDGVFPGSTAELAATTVLSERQRGAVLSGNARRLYALSFRSPRARKDHLSVEITDVGHVRFRCDLRPAGDAHLRGSPGAEADPRPRARGGDDGLQLGQYAALGIRRRHRPGRPPTDPGRDGRWLSK